MNRGWLFFFLLLFGGVDAQLFRGNKSISGQVLYQNSYDSGLRKRTQNLTVIPSFSCSLAPNWTAVLGIGYKSEVQKMDNNQAQKGSYAFVLAPSIKHYWIADSKLGFFLQLEAPIELGYIKNSDAAGSISRTDYWTCGLRLRPGMDYLLSSHWKVGATLGELGYTYYKTDEQEHSVETIKAGVSLSSISFSVKYLIPRKP